MIWTMIAVVVLIPFIIGWLMVFICIKKFRERDLIQEFDDYGCPLSNEWKANYLETKQKEADELTK